MSDELSKEHLLSGDGDDVSTEEIVRCFRQKRPRKNLTRYMAKYLVSLILIVSASLNALFFITRVPFAAHCDAERSPYTRLSYDKPTVYTFESEFWGENETLANELWDNIDITPIAVALSDDWVEEHNLEKSLRFPWDDEKGLYFIKAFHSLHCLKLIRKAYIDLEKGNEQLVTPHHVLHCLDAMRQDVMCKADDTPMPSWKPQHSVGDNQIMQCKDFDKLVVWTQEPERHACYNQIDDYRYIENTLERHAFCLEDSQYYPVMKAYFEKHGHKSPFGE